MEHADLAVIQSVLSRYHAMPVEERTQLVPVFAKLLAGVGQQPQPEPKYGDDEDDEESDATATTDVHGNPITDRSPLMPGHPDPRLVRRQQSPKVGNAKSSTPLDRARASRASRGQSRGSQELGVVTLASGETMMLRRSSSAGLVSAGHPRIGSQVALSPPIGPCARTECQNMFPFLIRWVRWRKPRWRQPQLRATGAALLPRAIRAASETPSTISTSPRTVVNEHASPRSGAWEYGKAQRARERLLRAHMKRNKCPRGRTLLGERLACPSLLWDKAT